MAASKTVRVVTGTKPPQYRAVNIVTSGDNRYPTYLQTTLDDRTFETVYNVGSPAVAGLKTVIIAGGTPAPTVTSVTPSTGTTLGGDSVVIAGTNFTSASAVKFGATDAASFVVNSDIQITATTPAGSAGAVHTTVTTPGGTSSTGSGDLFTYAVQTIAFVAAADGGIVNAASSMTYSYTCGSGSNRLLVVAVNGDATSDLVTGVTYNGVSMTLIGKQSTGAGGRWQYGFYLLNPASGAHNVVVSASGSCDHIFSGAADYTGVRQSGQPDVTAVDQSAGGAGSWTSTLVTTADSDWIILCEIGFNTDLSPPKVANNSVLRAAEAAFGSWGIFDLGSIAALTPAGSFDITTAREMAPGSSEIGHVAAAFKHA